MEPRLQSNSGGVSVTRSGTGEVWFSGLGVDTPAKTLPMRIGVAGIFTGRMSAGHTPVFGY